MTFIHRFSRSVSCTLEITDEPTEPGTSHIKDVVWTGRPKSKHLTEYVYWMHSVNSHLADLWQMKIMYAVQSSPAVWEFWGYEPGKPPKRITGEALTK